VKPIDPRLFRYSRSSRRFTIAATGIALLGAALTITQSALLAHFIVQIFVSHKSLNNLKATLIWIVVIYILKAILNYTSERLAAVSSSLNSGVLYDFATGSFFTPYVTMVGLYDNSYNLLAIAKLAQPLPTSAVTDTSILVNLDL
jgi:hypothetical protein